VAPAPAIAPFSPRERDVLCAVVRGLTNAAIAAELYISERTVEVHLQHAFVKLGIQEEPGVNKRVLAAVGFVGHLSA
jgi:DNA-binding NarL/FixJ family response regulator